MADGKIPAGTPPVTNGLRSALPWETPRVATSAPAESNGGGASVKGSALTEGAHGVHALQQVKGRVHRKLLERLNLSNLDRLDRQQVADAVRKVVQDLITQESVPLNF